MAFFERVTQVTINHCSTQMRGACSSLLFLEFGLCLPHLCDFADLAATVALPQLLNRALGMQDEAVRLEEGWFGGLAAHATRCTDLTSALRPGVFEERGPVPPGVCGDGE